MFVGFTVAAPLSLSLLSGPLYALINMQMWVRAVYVCCGCSWSYTWIFLFLYILFTFYTARHHHHLRRHVRSSSLSCCKFSIWMQVNSTLTCVLVICLLSSAFISVDSGKWVVVEYMIPHSDTRSWKPQSIWLVHVWLAWLMDMSHHTWRNKLNKSWIIE